MSLVFRQFVNEVGSLVLVNPLCNPLGFLVASFSESGWVGSVWKSEVKMVSRLFDVD